jgi:RimJ/RimL family protein N-acetyltransferase
VLGPILHAGAVSLEPPRREDMPTYLSWFQEAPEIGRFLWGRPAIPTLVQQEEWFDNAARSNEEVDWRIVVEGRTVGRASIFNIDWRNRHAETALLIGEPSLWGRGIASAAVRLRTGFAFDELGLERLDTLSLAGNIGMHRALERSGYQKLATLRRFAYGHGEWHDAYLLELLREDWQARDQPNGPG